MDTDMPTDTGTDTGMKTKANWLVATTGALCYCIAGPAIAQLPGSVITPIATPSAQNLPGAATVPNLGTQVEASSNEPATARAWTIVPRVGLTETLTDNINLTSTDTQSGLISQLSPGIRIDTRTARLKMFLDYQLDAIAYSTGDNGNQVQNYLNAFGTLEAVDNWLFLDFGGQISQQIINQFGQQSSSNVFNTGNTTETSTYFLSPFIRGQLGGSADYFLRYNTSVTNSQDSTLSDVTISQWLGQIKGNTTFQNLNWAIDGSQQNTNYSQGRDYDDSRIRALLIYRLFPEFRISGSGGYESNNYQSLDNEGNNTYGAGFDWTPTERTRASGFWEHRFFGTGHNVLLSHRFPLSSIRYTDTRDVSLIPNQFTTAGLGTVYDQYFQIFASLIPDPVSRDTYVRNLLNQAGIAPNAQAINNYLANRPQVQRNQQLSLVLFGSRNSITFLAGRSDSQPLTLAPNGLEGIVSESGRVTQQGYALSYSHRLTEFTGLNLLGSRQKNKSGLTNELDTTLTTYQIGISTRLGAKTVGALYARHQDFNGSDLTTTPYKENALIASVTMVF
jgi:uncharacterized protein (PEP-CTERM system associated)